MNDTSSSTDPKELLPYLAGAVLLSVFLVVLVLRFAPFSIGTASLTVVTFDVVKYTNAQRAVASAFIKPGSDIAKANELLLNLPDRTRVVIEEVAGSGTLVMVKQGVVQGQTEDITDKVLEKLGLPTEVPTRDGTEAAIDDLPTSMDSIFRRKTTSGSTPSLEGNSNSEVLP